MFPDLGRVSPNLGKLFRNVISPPGSRCRQRGKALFFRGAIDLLPYCSPRLEHFVTLFDRKSSSDSMLSVEIFAGVWVLCGLMAFALCRFRKRYTAADVGTTVIQITASAVLGGIALFAALTNDD
jgi:hypothetical protein